MIYQIELTVRTETALHIGTAAEGSTDSLFRRDGHDQLLVPGTAIAGALRGHLTRLAANFFAPCLALEAEDARPKRPCRCPICHLFGELQPANIARSKILDQDDMALLFDDGVDSNGFAKGTNLEDVSNEAFQWLTGRASRLIIHDALIPLEQLTKVRDGVGIDRSTGAASRQNRAKFDYEVVPAGVAFRVVLELEDADDTDQKLLQLGLEEWHAGRVRMGGHTGRGLGVLSIKEADYRVADPANKTEDFMNYIRGEGFRRADAFPRPDFTAHQANHAGRMSTWLEVALEFEIDGFFLSNDLVDAIDQGFNTHSKTLLPGASLRGVLRSHAEMIARSIAALLHGDDFLAHNPASNIMMVSRDGEDLPLEATASRMERHLDKKQRESRAALPFLDLADQLFGSSFQGSRLQVGDASLLDDPVWKALDFVAIDRFTGGSADQKKFDALALWKPRFAGQLYLENPADWELGWLLLTLRDLRDGLLTFGAGGSKGFGRGAAVNITLRTASVHPEASPIDLPTEKVGIWYQSAPVAFEQVLAAGFSTLQAALVKKLQDFDVPSDIAYQADSYTPQLRALYPPQEVQS